ncbi:MAG: LacI family DNA-binding transcriptional regulator [Lentisphaeria bacterium]|nr:LacI family DNA-binding transcriptional regulator [Lentisphaeria bacterium]
MAQRKTISDVAVRAGVSRSLVSAVLSGRKSTIRVSDATREKVLQAAREINYRPNLIAQSLHSRKSFLLAYLCTGGGSWGVSTRLLRSIQNACRIHDHSLVIYPSDSLEEEARNLQAALERQVDGIIVSPLMNIDKTNESLFQKVAESGTPVVQIGQIFSGIPGVTRDFFQIGKEAAEMLIESGRRNIVMVTYDNYLDPNTGPASYEEFQGFRQTMEKHGFPAEVVSVELSRFSGISNSCYKSSVTEAAYRQLSSILAKRKMRPDAFLASSNSLAYGAGFCCKENGWRIPEDCSIISCSDDIVLPSMILPSLSCYPLAASEIGIAAVEQCLNPEAQDVIRIAQMYQEEASFVM